MNKDEPQQSHTVLLSSSSSPSLSSPSGSDVEELQQIQYEPAKKSIRKCLSKQLSMCETPRDVAWEKRRRQILRQERKKNGINESDDITDEDLNELKGCIDLGFGFKEEEGVQDLCNTLPALDIYFAVNRQLSPSPVSTPESHASSLSFSMSSSSLGGASSSVGSPRSDSDTWKICSPGDNPQQVKTKLRHWAQAVACSVKQHRDGMF